MKKNDQVSGLIFLLLLVTMSCSAPQDIIPQLGEVKFGISKIGEDESRENGTVAPAYILFSISDTKGNVINTDKKISLYSFGDSYVSESLQFQTGNYILSKFLVLDVNNKVIYASPLKGSLLAKYVSTPLPVNFSITMNGNTMVVPQVLPVNVDTDPESFGYFSFSFEIVDKSYSFILNPNGLAVDSAVLVLEKDEQHLQIPFFQSHTDTLKAIAYIADPANWNFEVWTFSQSLPSLNTCTDVKWRNNPSESKSASRLKQVALPAHSESGGMITLPPCTDGNFWKNYYYNSIPTEVGPVQLFYSEDPWGTFLEIEVPDALKLSYLYADKLVYWTSFEGSGYQSEGIQDWHFCGEEVNYNHCMFRIEGSHFEFERKKNVALDDISYHDSFIHIMYSFENQIREASNGLIYCAID